MKLCEIFDNHYDELSNEAKHFFESSDKSVSEMEFESVKDYNDFVKDVYNIRLRKKNGESSSHVYEDYKDLISKGSFRNIWSYQNWKNVVV